MGGLGKLLSARRKRVARRREFWHTREDLLGQPQLIAERNDGAAVTKTRRLMFDAGLIPANGAGSTRLYTCLSKSPRFERTATKGHYQLLPEDEEQNGQDDAYGLEDHDAYR